MKWGCATAGSMRFFDRCRALALMLLAAVAGPASAHKSSDAYLQLAATPSGISLRVDVALRDLDVALDLDANADGRLTWGEVRTAWPAIDAYVRSRVQVAGCDLQAASPALERRIDGAYAALLLSATCNMPTEPLIRYTLLGDVDPTHRGIARIDAPGQPATLRVLDPARPALFDAAVPRQQAAADAVGAASAASHASAAVAPLTEAKLASSAAATEPASEAHGFLREGIRHIVTGYDHVLFLLCLLLPSVMRRTPEGWQPVDRLSQAVWPVAGIVTAFTVAHSITLALAAMKWVSLPPSFIEPAIAITIILAALDNLRSIFHGRRVIVTFLFGLIHGFGFAGVLAELNLPTAQFAWALLQFNLGLELGQLLIVGVAASLLFALRRGTQYPAWAIRGGSVAAIAIGVLWFVERTANVSLMPL